MTPREMSLYQDHHQRPEKDGGGRARLEKDSGGKQKLPVGLSFSIFGVLRGMAWATANLPSKTASNM